MGLAVADLLCCVAALAVTYGRDDQAAAYSERGQVRLLTAIYGPFVHHTTVNSDVCTVLLDDMLFAISNSLSFSDCTLFQPSTETLPHACFVHYMKLFFSWTKRRDSEVSWIKFYRMRRPKHILESVYGPFVQNACAKSNTWLTVVVAVGRYMVICRPLTTSIPTTSKTTFMNVSFRDVDQTTPRLLTESPIIRLPVKDNAIRYIQQVLHKTT